MKHIKKLLVIVSLISAATVCLAACGGSNIPGAHEHTYSAAKWEYDERSHWRAATCDHDWLKGDEGEHTFTDSKSGTETCTEGATVTRTCSTCGYTYTYETEPLGHTWVPMEGDPADCQHAGYTDYEECSVCHTKRGKNEIPQGEHQYYYEEVMEEDAEGVPQPTGQHHLVCIFCGEEKQGSRATHNFTGEYLHDAEGHWQLCVCGAKSEVADHEESEEILGHDETGHWKECTVCGEVMTKTDHTWSEEIAAEAPDCENPGHTAYKECTECHETLGYTDLPATGHNYEYKYNEEGTEHWQECTNENCPNPKTEEEAHEFGSEYQHDANGHWQTCVCGYSTESAEHTEGEDIIGWDENDHWTECPICGEAAASTSHNFEDVEGQAPTCEADGYAAYQRCQDCGYETEHDVLYATGHDYKYKSEGDEHWLHCDHEGCEAPDLAHEAHTFGAFEHNATQHWQTCTKCGAEVKANHTYADKKYDKDATHHWLLCDDCGEPQSTKTPHSFASDTGSCECGATESATEYFTYDRNDNGYTVTGFVADIADIAGEKTAFAIPEMHEGYPVTAIGEAAFLGNTAVTKLVLPATVTTIGDFAFQGCTALQEITLPAGLTELGTFDYQVFNGCSALKAIVIPEGVTVIGNNTFNGCAQLASVQIKGEVTKVGDYAFYGCTKLEGLTLNSELTYLGQRAFATSGIKTLTVALAENGRIAQGAFEGCTGLTTLAITGGIKYFSSPILAGCTGLETLTVPFVGDNIETAKGTDSHFGFIFGKSEGSYSIPETLTSVTVTGGEVLRHAFDSCGTLAVTAEAEVDVKTISFVGYTGTFTWKNTEGLAGLTAPTVEASVEPTKPITEGGSVTLTYTVTPKEADETPYAEIAITVAVAKGDAAAEQGEDKDYTVEGNTYTFNKAGTYTITVTAKYNGKEAHKDVTVTVELPGPNLGDITASGEGYEKGVVGKDTAVTLEFTYEGETATQITYSVKKGSADAAKDTDYTIDEAQKQITFKTAGIYTVTVTATRNEKTESKSITITVTDPDATAPTIGSFTAEKTEGIIEGCEPITLTVEATYAGEGETLLEKSYAVSFNATAAASYENAQESYYKIEGDTFQPLVAGYYQITVTVMGSFGGSVTKELELTVGKVDLTEAFTAPEGAVNGWVRVASDDTAHKLTYSMGDAYLGGYNVSYAATNGVTPNGVEGETAFNIQLADPNTSTVTITYTHKTATDATYTFKVDVSFVTDVANAPVLGTDPFGGTYNQLLNSFGLQLYWDVTDKATEGTQLALADVTFAVVDGTNTTGRELIVEHVASNETLPWYAILAGWKDAGGNGTETGKVAIKLTATKGEAIAAATMEFEVIALSNPAASTGINNYAKKVMGEEKSKDIDFDCIMEQGNHENAILTKEGIIEHRVNADWGPASNIFCVRPELADNFQLDFDFTIYGKTTDGKVALTLNYRTGAWEGWSNDMYLESKNNAENISVYGGGDGYGTQSWEDSANGIQGKPASAIGSVTHIRMKHTVAEGQLTVEWTWSTDGTTYYPWWKFETAASSSQGNVAAPVSAIQFRHNAGCFMVSNVTLQKNIEA